MAESLSSACTGLKKEYDGCFNSWFEGYLEPAVAASADGKAKAEYSRRKAEEFDAKCGRVWKAYRECVQKAVKEKGLDGLLNQAREENPLKEQPGPVPSETV